MFLTAENILLVGSILIFSSILISKTGYRFGIPTLLLFLVVGMAFGCDGLGVEFDNVKDAQFIGMVALSIILFSGGMDTRFSDIKPVLAQGIMLSTVGVLITTLLTGGFIFYLSGWTNVDIQLPLLTCMLLAATMSSTDSASVFNLLRSQNMNLKHNLRPTLELESGSNDPMAYMLTIVLIQLIGTGVDFSLVEILSNLLMQFFFGGVIGFAMGKFGIWLINKINLSTGSLYPILMLCIVFITFTVTDQVNGNGYLAVYITGVIIGNSKMAYRKEITTFMNGMTWLSQIVMFLALGLLVNPHELPSVALISILIAIFMIFIARPATVFACTMPIKGIPAKAKLFMSWVGLRGAVPIIFSTYPVVAGIEGSGQIFNIVFFITLLSLIIQGMTITPMAKKLKLDLPVENEGNTFGVELPDELDSQLADLIVTDEMLTNGNKLMDIHLPEGTLVMIVKRGNKYVVPNGRLQLKGGDKLLLISETRKQDYAVR